MLRRLLGRGQSEQIGHVTPRDVQQRIAEGESVLLLDVRQPDEYRDAHVAGSTLIPLPELAHRIDELPRNRSIAVICRSGNRSGVAATMLARAGFADVANLEGGILAWQRQGLPVERGR